MPGKTRCPMCAASDVEYQLAKQKARIEAKQCTVCGDTATHGAGTKAPVCDAHWETRKAMQKRYYQRVAAEAKAHGMTYKEWRHVRGSERRAA